LSPFEWEASQHLHAFIFFVFFFISLVDAHVAKVAADKFMQLFGGAVISALYTAVFLARCVLSPLSTPKTQNY
jgi:hypothetical protein